MNTEEEKIETVRENLRRAMHLAFISDINAFSIDECRVMGEFIDNAVMPPYPVHWTHWTVSSTTSNCTYAIK